MEIVVVPQTLTTNPNPNWRELNPLQLLYLQQDFSSRGQQRWCFLLGLNVTLFDLNDVYISLLLSGTSLGLHVLHFYP